MRDFKKELDAMLEEHGGLYTFEDVIDAIQAGRMQSFSNGDTWAVTQVNVFPRKRVLDLVFVVGNLDELHGLEDSITEYAKEVQADIITATGRMGWLRKHFDGWKATSVNFVRV